jgi:hypothetical protein
MVFLLMLAASLGLAQEGAEKTPIKVFKKGLGHRYTYEAKPLVSWNDFQIVMADSPASLSQLRKAKTMGTVSLIFSAAGGALIGWPVGTAIAGGDPSWWLAAAGGGAVIVGVVFSASSAKRLKQSVDTYNGELALRDDGVESLEVIVAANGIYVSVKL